MQAWRFGPEEARRIAQPVLGVLGADSDAVTPLFGEGHALLRTLVPQTEPFVLPAATHGLQIMNPRGMAEGLAAFFARHPLEPQLASPATAGPVKLVALYGVPTDAAAFERDYAATHVPLARQLPGLKRVETARSWAPQRAGPRLPPHRRAVVRRHGKLPSRGHVGRGARADGRRGDFATGGLTVLVAQVDAADAAAVPPRPRPR